MLKMRLLLVLVYLWI